MTPDYCNYKQPCNILKVGTTKLSTKLTFCRKALFDLQSMIMGFLSLVRTKLTRCPGAVIKPAIINQDIVENHFCQLRGANGHNDIPTYQATQNSIIYGQTSISRKGNTGTRKNSTFSEIPIEHIFTKKKHVKEQKCSLKLTKELQKLYRL